MHESSNKRLRGFGMWQFDSAYTGYHKEKSNSARFVYHHRFEKDLWMVVKVFDRTKMSDKGVRQLSTLKVWRAEKLDETYMSWKSTTHAFEPSDEQLLSVEDIAYGFLDSLES